MKQTQKRIAMATVVATVLAGLAWFNYQALQKVITPKTKTAKQSASLSVCDYFGQELEQEQVKVWASFQKIGINKQRYEQAKIESRSRYLQSDFPGGSGNVSPQTKQFVHNTLRELGFDPTTITLRRYRDWSPAAATERVMYIDESELKKYSLPAQRFVIGHEAEHIRQKDNHSRFTLESLTHKQVEKLGNNKEHPICQYNRFKEKRADIMTATRGKPWAEGYLAFAQEWHKRAGDNPGLTHPLNKDRVALAQRILDYMVGKAVA